MSDHPRATDAELVERLRLRKQFSAVEVATQLGITAGALRASLQQAKARGLTADSKVIDDVGRLKQEIKIKDKRIEALTHEEDTAETIRKTIYGLAERTPEPPKWLIKDGTPGRRGAPVLMVGDLHYGEVISKDEVAGVNEYNIEIAYRRLEKLADRTIDLAFNHMGRAKTEYPGIVLCFMGDMIGGDIHEELAKTNDRTTQQGINDLTDMLASFIETMVDKFGRA